MIVTQLWSAAVGFGVGAIALCLPTQAQVTIDNLVPGTLATAGPQVLTSVVPATLRVENAVPVEILVSEPRWVSGPSSDPQDTQREGIVTFGATEIRSTAPPARGQLSAGLRTLQVNMTVQRPASFPPGRYQYAVTLTVIP